MLGLVGCAVRTCRTSVNQAPCIWDGGKHTGGIVASTPVALSQARNVTLIALVRRHSAVSLRSFRNPAQSAPLAPLLVPSTTHGFEASPRPVAFIASPKRNSQTPLVRRHDAVPRGVPWFCTIRPPDSPAFLFRRQVQAVPLPLCC